MPVLQSACCGLWAVEFCVALVLKQYFNLILAALLSRIFLHLLWLCCIFALFPADTANH